MFRLSCPLTRNRRPNSKQVTAQAWSHQRPAISINIKHELCVDADKFLTLIHDIPGADLQVWETEWTALTFTADLDKNSNKLVASKAAVVILKAHDNSLKHI
jgi:hypothetical protein